MSEYPTQKQLNYIETMDFLDAEASDDELCNFLWFVEGCWNHNYGKIKKTGKRVIYIEFHTGGWSGNEDIIQALSKNLFWRLYWQKSERGGHYYFKIRKELNLL